MPRHGRASAWADAHDVKEVPMPVDNRSTFNIGGYAAAVVILAILLILVTPEKAAADAAIAAITDQALRQTISHRVDVGIGPSGRRINLDVANGIVLLSGEVPHLMAKERVQRIVESVIGVRAVVNTITAGTVQRKNPAIDEDVRSRIRQALPMSGDDVTVSVEGATVTLGGITNSWVASRMAAQAAMSVKGVSDVVTTIDVAHRVQREDRDIKRDVLYRLANDVYLHASTINVAVEDGLVSLSGNVATLSDKRRAVNNAWVTGVTAVDDTALMVDWPKAMQDRRTRRYVPKSDPAIRQAVADALQLDPRTTALNIEVAVVNGAVTLSGIVDTLYARRAAEADARGTTGVWRVDNQLRVRYRPFPEDEVVKRRIEDVFNRDAELHPLKLDVAVRDNHVVLTGKADNLAQKIRAEDIASQIAGIAWLDNRIVVKQQLSRKAGDGQIAAAVEESLDHSPYIASHTIAVAVDDGRAVLTGRAADQFVVHTAVRNAFKGGAESVRTSLVLEDGSTAAAFYTEVSDVP
jgi:osmotically-inducible protein OsmY